MADMIGDYMQKHGVKFQRGWVPTKLERVQEGAPGVIKVDKRLKMCFFFLTENFSQVTAQNEAGEIMEEEYNTVLFAIGRDACTNQISIENAGVKLNPK